ncbi:unnamed protein product [Pleuronectes platessa]|uniref:Uncharacterized protein n=1 Tax=Pleuronectes platessa TaxID=8262 RepID=A0A9N7V3K0_PLEPL|nr:unnamed protein product [Pleuronectes platessa]
MTEEIKFYKRGTGELLKELGASDDAAETDSEDLLRQVLRRYVTQASPSSLTGPLFLSSSGGESKKTVSASLEASASGSRPVHAPSVWTLLSDDLISCYLSKSGFEIQSPAAHALTCELFQVSNGNMQINRWPSRGAHRTKREEQRIVSPRDNKIEASFLHQHPHLSGT